MKKYIFIFSIISLIFVNAYSEDSINEQTENMLNEIRNRNGVDYFLLQLKMKKYLKMKLKNLSLTYPKLPA